MYFIEGNMLNANHNTYPIPSTLPPKMETERKKRRRAQHTKIDLVVKMINAHETKMEYVMVMNQKVNLVCSIQLILIILYSLHS